MFYVYIATELSIKMEKDRIIWAVDFIFDCDIRECSYSLCCDWLYWAPHISCSPPLCIEVPVAIQKNEHLCICVVGVSYLPLFLLDLGLVPTV